MRFWWNESRSQARRRTFLIAVIGGVFGILDLFWPALILQGRLMALLSRIADSLLYVAAHCVVPSLFAPNGVRAATCRSSSRACLSSTCILRRRLLTVTKDQMLRTMGMQVTTTPRPLIPPSSVRQRDRRRPAP